MHLAFNPVRAIKNQIHPHPLSFHFTKGIPSLSWKRIFLSCNPTPSYTRDAQLNTIVPLNRVVSQLIVCQHKLKTSFQISNDAQLALPLCSIRGHRRHKKRVKLIVQIDTKDTTTIFTHSGNIFGTPHPTTTVIRFVKSGTRIVVGRISSSQPILALYCIRLLCSSSEHSSESVCEWEGDSAVGGWRDDRE